MGAVIIGHVTGECKCCSKKTDKYDLYRVTCKGDSPLDKFVDLCPECLDVLNQKISLALHKTPNMNDVIWELVYCDDGEWRIFPMTVKSIISYGQTRKLKDGTYATWNIYAEGDYTYMYASFYDKDRTWFFTEEEAQAGLEKAKAGSVPGNKS